MQKLVRWVPSAARWRPVARTRTGVIGGGLLLLTLALTMTGPAANAAASSSAAGHSATSCGGGIWLERQHQLQGFNPLTATGAQLHAADFPARPTRPDALAVWRRYAANYLAGKVSYGSSCNLEKVPQHTRPPLAAKNGTVTPNLVPADGSSPSLNWAGNIDHNAAYTDAEAEWVVNGAISGYTAYSNAWVGVGLGDYSAYPLVQAGSESDSGCGLFHNQPCASFAWLEAFPEDPYELQIPDLDNITGDLLMVHVNFTHTTDGWGHMNYHIVDVSKSINLLYHENFYNTKPDGHAEFIVERPTVGGKLPRLAEWYPDITFQSAQSYAPSTGWRGVGNLSHYWLWMVSTQDSSRVLAKPGSISSDGYSFAAHWYNDY